MYLATRSGGNRAIALGLGAFVGSIFFFTMYQMRQLADVGLGKEFNERKGGGGGKEGCR